MKRAIFVALAAVALLGLVACASPTSSSSSNNASYTFPSGTGAGGGTSTTWWIKGSFDSWAGGGDVGTTLASPDPRHYLSIDSLNSNLLALGSTVLTGLTQGPVEFVLEQNNSAGTVIKKFDFVYNGSTLVFADNTPYTLVDDATVTGGGANPAFIASATTYTIKVDVSTPSSPKVLLVPGSTPTTTPTLAQLKSGLQLIGNQFTIGWAKPYTPGTISGSTVTWSGLALDPIAGQKTGTFGFNDFEGVFLKAGDVSIPSPTVLNGTANVNLTSRGSKNASITSPPYQDSIYTVAVTIDPTKTVYTGRYSMVVTLTTVGSTPWPTPIDTTLATNAMTNGTGAGSSWGAQLGSVSTAVSGGFLLVKAHFSTVNAGNNVYLLVQNAALTNGATAADLAGDLTTGWGNLGFTSDTSGFRPNLVAWGSRDSSAVFSVGGVKTLDHSGASLVGTAVTGAQAANGTTTSANDDIWFQIPLTALGLTSVNNQINVVVLFGKDSGGGGLHSAIPAAIDTANYADIPSVASATLSGL